MTLILNHEFVLRNLAIAFVHLLLNQKAIIQY